MKSRQDKATLAVLVSGNGTNLQALVDACASGSLQAEIALVVSNVSDAYALERAKQSGIKTAVVERGQQDRYSYDTMLSNVVSESQAGLVVLAGWDRLLSNNFLENHQVINLHPALPGTFPGLGAIKKSYEAWQNGQVDSGGVMVHYVPDEGVDDGPVIGSAVVPIFSEDSFEMYEQRVHQAEHELLVTCVAKVLKEQSLRGYV